MYKILFISIVVLAGNIYMLEYFEYSEAIRFAGMSIVGLGFLFGLHQLKANQDWNRRSTALLEMEKHNPKYFKALRSLTYERTIMKLEHRKEAYSADEIHGFICEKDKKQKGVRHHFHNKT